MSTKNTRRTKVITYNLHDRQRLANTGVDRSDVDMQTIINHINSDETQELVRSGDLLGYYGHETRARFGLFPPDSFINEDGETIRIEPAFSTTMLSCTPDGDVSTQHEFLSTGAGEYAYGLYKSKVGGFSTAVARIKNQMRNIYEIIALGGFDYVLKPNYNSNRGEAMFDSLMLSVVDADLSFDSSAGVQLSPHQVIAKNALESAIISQQQAMSIANEASGQTEQYQYELRAAEQMIMDSVLRREKTEGRRASRELEIADNLLCPSVSFDSIQDEWGSFKMGDNDSNSAASAWQTEQDAKQLHDQAEHERSRQKVNLFGRK